MAKSHHPAKFTVVEEQEEEEEETHCLLDDEEEEEEPSEPRGCFPPFPCFRSTRESRAGGGAAATSSWAPKRSASLREAAAGHSNWWKTNLVRKFERYFTKKKKKKKNKNGEFQYDFEEYALNFDDEEEEERFVRGFSVRYAPSPSYRDTKFVNVAS